MCNQFEEYCIVISHCLKENYKTVNEIKALTITFKRKGLLKIHTNATRAEML